MTIIGRILEIINSQASHRNEALQNIYHLSHKVSEHLVKILIWGNSTHDLNTWSKEVGGWLRSINAITVKTRSKRLSWEDYKENLFDPHFETEREFKDYCNLIIQDCIDEGYPEPPTYNLDILWKKLRDTIDTDYKTLFNSGSTTKQEFILVTRKLGE